MKLLFLFFGLAVTVSCTAQEVRGEFATNTNGLMYNDADMNQLRFIVDSLNLKFKTCPLNKVYYSCPQAKVYYVLFKSSDNDLLEIKNDINSNFQFNVIIQKYSAYINILDTSEILIRTNSKDKNDEYYYLQGNPFNGYDGFYWDKKKYSKKDQSFVDHWMYDYSAKRKNNDHYTLEARFFPEKLKQTPLPASLGSLIQYVDCMIDTNSVVFLTDKYSGGYFGDDEKDTYSNISPILEYINKKIGKDEDLKNAKGLDKIQMDFAANNLKHDPLFKNILAEAIDDCVKNKSFHFQLEELAQKLGLYDKALAMKRSYRVMGQCSQDQSPRYHARDIAILAAQSHSWDIFLRAHLDIMNDRFERVSDGSYAYGDRKTYLKELEDLNLNIVDLMLGLTLRADNIADNHYYGTIWRMGWALTESREKDRFEQTAIDILKVYQLDEFNRGLVFLLFHTYISYLDEKEQIEKITRLRSEINSIPVTLHSSINRLKVRKRSD